MNFGIRLFFLIFAPTNNPYIYDRTTVTAKDRVAYVCRQSNHRYRSAAGGQKYAFKDDKCYIVFRLNGFNRNLRTELKKGKKIYFYDNGIRNAILQNFVPLSLRQDTGALWENFIISERIKANQYSGRYANSYFWRTTQQQEIDYIEECDGQFTVFEMKWNTRRANTQFPSSFLTAYDVKETAVITPDNWMEWVV